MEKIKELELEIENKGTYIEHAIKHRLKIDYEKEIEIFRAMINQLLDLKIKEIFKYDNNI